MRHSRFTLPSLVIACLFVGIANAADYVIDTDGGHAFVNFKFRHLGLSILTGTFEKLEGEFSWDPESASDSSVSITIDTRSLNSYHAERDRHMRGDKYLDTEEYPRASFVSTRVEDQGEGDMVIHGDLTLRGVTREVAIEAHRIGEGNDPWGDYRAGFEGYVTLDMRDYGVNSFVPGHTVDMELFIEGIRQ